VYIDDEEEGCQHPLEVLGFFWLFLSGEGERIVAPTYQVQQTQEQHINIFM
jgi:hypothetical protein